MNLVFKFHFFFRLWRRDIWTRTNLHNNVDVFNINLKPFLLVTATTQINEAHVF